MRCLIPCFLIAVLFCTSSVAQSRTSKLVEATKLRSDGSSTFVDIVNRSDKNLVGYVLEVESKSIQTTSATTFTHIVAMRPGGKTSKIFPGSSFTDKLRHAPLISADDRPLDYDIRVDFVVFEDGSTWGPDTKLQGARLAGTLHGIQQERARLQRLLANKGQAALVADIKAD